VSEKSKIISYRFDLSLCKSKSC